MASFDKFIICTVSLGFLFLVSITYFAPHQSAELQIIVQEAATRLNFNSSTTPITNNFPATTLAEEQTKEEKKQKQTKVKISKNDAKKVFLEQREREYERRNQLLRKGCEYYRKNNPELFRSISEVADFRYCRNDEFKLLFGVVKKAGSSSWKNNFEQLARRQKISFKRVKTPMDRNNTINKELHTFWNSSIQEGYLSFTFTRHPFSRILSAHTYLFVYTNTKRAPLLSYGRKIASQYRTKEEKNKTIKKGLRFSEFVRYLLDGNEQEDCHWRPAAQVMFPCGMSYDVLGKQETFSSDSRYVIQKQGLERILHVRHDNVEGSSQRRSDSYSQITRSQLDDLYRIYETDFRLFGYDPSPYYKLVKQ